MRNVLLELLEVLDLLSSSPMVQLDYLNSMSIDELGLEFDDIYNLIGYKEDLKKLNKKQLSLLADLNSKLNQMSKKKSLWTKEALMHNKEWKEVRDIANEIKEDILSSLVSD